MKGNIQNKINSLKNLAQASKGNSSLKDKRSAMVVEDSLSKAITTKKEADLFLAELAAAIKTAQQK